MHRNSQQEAHNAKRGVFSRAGRTALVKVVRGDEAANEPADPPFTCWGLSSFCAESGHKCRKAGACIYAPPNAAGVQPAASPEDRRLAAMFAGDDDSLVVQTSAKENGNG